MNDPIILNIQIRYDGSAIAFDLALNREVSDADRLFLSQFVDEQIVSEVKKLTFTGIRIPPP